MLWGLAFRKRWETSFDPPFIYSLLSKTEAGVQKSVPYCWCLFPQTGSRCNVQMHWHSITFEGVQLVDIQPGCFPFNSLQNAPSGGRRKAKSHIYQGVGLFLWRNMECLFANPPPRDMRLFYEVWIQKCLPNSMKMSLRKEAFEKVFLVILRSEKQSFHSSMSK